MRAAAQLLLGIFGIVVITPWAADAATISGTVAGPDGAAFRGAFVQARNAKSKIVVSVLSLAALVPLIIPALSLELGQEDIGATSPDTTERQAYDLITAGFGVGYNGPLQVASAMDPPAQPSATYWPHVPSCDTPLPTCTSAKSRWRITRIERGIRDRTATIGGHSCRGPRPGARRSGRRCGLAAPVRASRGWSPAVAVHARRTATGPDPDRLERKER